MKLSSLILLAILIFAFNVYPQKMLTLNDAISIALKESYGIKSAEYSLVSSQKALEAVRLGMRTSINMQFDLPNYSRTLSSQFNPATGSQEFFTYGYTTLQGKLFFNQPIIFTNGTFSLVGSLWKRNQFSTVQDIPTDYYSNLSLRLNQPLFTFNTQAANLRRSELNLDVAKRNYTAAEEDVIYNVTASFYALYKAKKNVEISEERVKQSDTSYNTAENKYKAGLIAQVEALQLEVDLATSKNELLNAQNIYQDAKRNFQLLIGLPLDEKIDISAKLDFAPIKVNQDEAVQFAVNNRAELKNDEADIELKKLTVDETSSNGNIRGNLSVNYGINKNDDAFSKIFRDFAEDRSLVFSLSVPVLDWGKNNREVESAEANLEQSKLNYKNETRNIKQEIISIVNKIKSAKARVEVLSKSVELAQKSYDISLSRFQSGNITSFDLSQMQLRLTDAKVNSLNALIDYKIAVADLERRTMHKYR